MWAWETYWLVGGMFSWILAPWILALCMTNDLVRRVHEHKSKSVPGFTRRYGVDRLVWFEIYDDPATAISREKELKKWRRDWKIRLIEEQNPDWCDLYETIVK